MASNSTIDYARLAGIRHSEAPYAVVFAGLYVLCLPIFVVLSFKRPTFVWRFLVVFCLGTNMLRLHYHATHPDHLVRATAFVLRSILAIHGSTSLNLVITEQVIYGVGFFGLLYSAYTLVLDRCAMSF